MKAMATVLTCALASCATVPAGTAAPAVTGQSWKLTTLRGDRVTRRTATLRFEPNGKITGTWGRNDVGPGQLQWTATPGGNGGTIDAEGATSGIITTVGCPNAVADRFWRAMPTATD